ncbi:MAG: hypothetical protein ACYDCK_01590 [Thermoplasmatota archaeon]
MTFTRHVSLRAEDLELVGLVSTEFGGFSKFVRIALAQYAQAKGRGPARVDEMGPALLRAQVAEAGARELEARAVREHGEQLLEEHERASTEKRRVKDRRSPIRADRAVESAWGLIERSRTDVDLSVHEVVADLALKHDLDENALRDAIWRRRRELATQRTNLAVLPASKEAPL